MEELNKILKYFEDNNVNKNFDIKVIFNEKETGFSISFKNTEDNLGLTSIGFKILYNGYFYNLSFLLKIENPRFKGLEITKTLYAENFINRELKDIDIQKYINKIFKLENLQEATKLSTDVELENYFLK